MKDLPWELIEKIMKYSGAYHFEQHSRPYITTFHCLGNIIASHGIKRAIIHHREMDALEHSYAGILTGGAWLIPVLRPIHSPFHQTY